ncbi:hypothetical protein [Streptomyces sp. Y1]|uniref:Uncharacterized protein n=1 Tax=Streptomyces sp. Y1 TaxID=3238634 RepID=A0AB39TTY1_9ACTN
MAPRAPRRIHVDGRDYRWAARRHDLGHVTVRIWLDRPGRPGRVLAVTCRFDDPWLHYGFLLSVPPERLAAEYQLEPVTPALTADLVRSGLAAGWQPEQPGEAARFLLEGDALVPAQ